MAVMVPGLMGMMLLGMLFLAASDANATNASMNADSCAGMQYQNIKIVNMAPPIQGDAPDKTTAYQSVQVFSANGQCVAANGGCTVVHSASYVLSYSELEPNNWPSWATSSCYRKFGLQWNIARLAENPHSCDQTCRQVFLDFTKCSKPEWTSRSASDYCNSSTPEWYPIFDATLSGNTCTITVTHGSYTGKYSTPCGCNWGKYPCTCPGPKCFE